MNEKRANGMGRIFRRKRSPFLWLQYYSQDGEQIRVSSGTDNEKKAAKKLRGLLGEVAAGIHRDTRRVKYEDLRDSFYLDYETNQRKSLRRDVEGKPVLDKVQRLDAFFSGYTATEITTDLIRRFIADQQGRGLANGTINRSLSALRRMFNIAKQDGKLRNAAPYFPMLKEAAPRQGFVERKQYDALSSALPEYLRLPLALGFFTAMRLGEILALEWSQVDFFANTIRLRAGETKNDSAREIPIVPELRALLEKQHAKRERDFPLVCFRLDAKGRAVRMGSFRKPWSRCCVAVGLGTWEPVVDGTTGKPILAPPRGPRSKAKAKMIYKGTIFHDLRRSAIRSMVRAGIPERVAQNVSGHLTRSTFERYNIVSPADISEAGRKLAAFHTVNGDTAGTQTSVSQPARMQ